MKSCIFLLVALGLAVAMSPSKRKLPIYGLLEGNSIRNNFSPFLELRSSYPQTHMFNLPLTPELLSFKSFNDFQFSNNHLRNQHPSLRDVLHEPAVLVMKSSPEATDLEAYILERGLSSLAENPSTRFIHDKIKNGADKNAVVAHPSMLLKTPAFKTLKEMPVKKTEIAGSIKFANLARCLNTNLPFIFIYDEENLDIFDSDGLIRLGSLDVSDNKIQ